MSLLVLLLASGAAVGRHTARSEPTVAIAAAADAWTCEATWYTAETRTASGEMFDPLGLTAASPHLEFGTRLLVTNLRNQVSVVVRVNDRGPSGPGRCIDLAKGAFERLAHVESGVIPVRIEPLAPAPLRPEELAASRG